MNFILSFLTLSSVFFVQGQQNDKGTSMIPFPRIGRADPRFFMDGKRNGNSVGTPGLIPFPRIGRSDGIHEIKRQLIPFPRVGKRPYWRIPMEPYPMEYDDYAFPLMDAPSVNPSNGLPDWGISGMPEESDAEKRSAGANPNNNSNNGGGMWFGPRLGRRKRSIETETSGDRSHDTTMDTRMLLKILHNFNWAIVPIKERRTFTPRLGRSSSEEASSGGSGGTHQRYTPRLGRSREAAFRDVDEEPEQTHRFSRGGNDGRNPKPKGQSEDTNTGGFPFSPRLGRDHINPRLGRSSTDEHD